MYYVVFENLGDRSRRYRAFDNKASFDHQYQPVWGRIVDEGVTKERALRLCGATAEIIEKSRTGKSDYLVVFEYTELTGGSFRNRTRIGYHSQFEFKSLLPFSSEIIVAEGISEAKSCELLYTVPPLCLYMAAVEEAFENELRYIPLALEMKLYNATLAVESSQKYLWEHLLSASFVDENLREFYLRLTRENTAKNTVMRNILVLYDYDSNDLNLLSRGAAFVKTMKYQCEKALKLFPLE